MLAASPTAAPPPTPLPCVIDIEASGFGRGSYPIEVGYVLPNGSTFCTLVRPAAHWTHWDGDAERLHGLSRALLEQHGKSPAEVAGLLNEQLRGCTIYCDSWAHDYAWLAILFEEAGLTPTFKLRHLRELMDESDAAHWDGACSDARETLQITRHRASSDARVLQLALGRVKGLLGPGAVVTP
jgi:hypothetical protein